MSSLERVAAGPRPKTKAGSRATGDLTVFTQLLDDVLKDERANEVTSQKLFNQLVLRAWEQQSLGELAVKREEFASELQKRGWRYDARKHVWRRGDSFPLLGDFADV